MDITILALIIGTLGALVYYLDQTFIQKRNVDMNSTFKVFLLCAGIVYLTSIFLDNTGDIVQTGAGGSASNVSPNTRISSNQEMMTGDAPF